MKATILISLPESIRSFWSLRRFFGRFKKHLPRKFTDYHLFFPPSLSPFLYCVSAMSNSDYNLYNR